MGERNEINGKKFGRLTVIEFVEMRGKYRFYKCICECGKFKIIRSSHLKSGNTISCGCFRKELGERSKTHGKESSKVYQVWTNMLQRCYNPNDRKFKNYGGRGIIVCDRWHKFENFYADMGDPPYEKSLDRINNDGFYCLENCRWATRIEQMNNRRNSVKITYLGETKGIREWERQLGFPKDKITKRLKAGWSVEDAITLPNSQGQRINKCVTK